MTVHSETTPGGASGVVDTAAADHAALLAELARGRASAVLVQDATGAVHVLPYLDRLQVDDPDVVVLMTRDQAVTALAAVMATHLSALTAAGAFIPTPRAA